MPPFREKKCPSYPTMGQLNSIQFQNPFKTEKCRGGPDSKNLYRAEYFHREREGGQGDVEKGRG
jgi:hypothetical protein